MQIHIKPFTTIATLVSTLMSGSLSANELTFTSTTSRTPLVELFTSEGCSSCPPADAWLSTLQHSPGLWRDFIPIAFHVDYWDRLGWKDVLASPANSHRQQVYHQQKLSSGVYTPGFVIGGKEWRQWFQGDKLLPKNQEQTGVLKLSIKGRNIKAHFSPKQNIESPLILNIAVLGMGIKHAIGWGENKNKILSHDFVILSHQQISGSNHTWQAHLAGYPRQGATQLALAGWLATPQNQSPIQAVGGWIPSLP